jgi:ABC-type glycerol-3-phosphate transport system permease component
MLNGLFTLTWANVKSALIYGALALITTFLLSLLQSVLNAGSIFGLDWKSIIDSAAIATIPVLITFISLGKNLLTTSQGNFLGVTEVIPDKTDTTKSI